MMDKKVFEKLADSAFRKFSPIAKKYYYSFHRPSVTRGGVPGMIFLGNHSSGKSSLINWILGGAPEQETGLAPTDDGFTILMFGESEEDICGPAALSRLPEEFRALESFGANFLQHLKVKLRNNQLLKTVTLIDSPGMIDSAQATADRTYDFEGVVKLFAEACDVVFFLFDPDKPGTTGETVSVFSKCLSGVEFKLRVLLNKCDAFTDLYDFARTYGTVCWNLARALRTKDLPKIWTLYSGSERPSTSLDLTAFNKHREEFLDVINNASSRRMDNVYSQAASDFVGLSIRMRIINHVARRLALFKVFAFFAVCLPSAAAALATGYILTHNYNTGDTIAAIAAAAATSIVAACLIPFAKLAKRIMRNRLSLRADAIFEKEYRRELAVGTHENIRQRWADIRSDTVDIMRSAPLKLPIFGELKRRRLDKTAVKVFKARTSGT